MREAIINFVTLLGILGIPSIFAMFVYCLKGIKKVVNKFDVLMESQQAQIRGELLKDYKKYMKQGWIEIDDLTDFENRYNKYHSLGANGVMDEKWKDIVKLPNIPPA